MDGFGRLSGLRGRPGLGYGLAFAAALAALALRLWLDPALPPGFPFLTFFPAVVLTAFVAGTGPGVLCAALSGLAAWWFFVPPVGSLALTGASALAMGFFVAILAVDIALIGLAFAAADRLRAERGRTAGLLDQQRVMFQELQHRVANNMAFVASLLRLQRRAVAADPSLAVGALDEAMARIETMSRIHRRLYDPASADLPVGRLFREMCSDLLRATGARNIVCLVDMPAVRLDVARLITLSLLVAEVVTNSLKHAFEGREGGTIQLTLERLDADTLALSVRDDGRGMPPAAAADAGKAGRGGLGTRIVEGLAAQLGGTLGVSPAPGGGTDVRLVFPAAVAAA